MNEYRRSVAILVRSTVRHWVAFVTTSTVAAALLLVLAIADRKLPTQVWILLGLSGIPVSAFLSFHDIRVERDSLKRRELNPALQQHFDELKQIAQHLSANLGQYTTNYWRSLPFRSDARQDEGGVLERSFKSHFHEVATQLDAWNRCVQKGNRAEAAVSAKARAIAQRIGLDYMTEYGNSRTLWSAVLLERDAKERAEYACAKQLFPTQSTDYEQPALEWIEEDGYLLLGVNRVVKLGGRNAHHLKTLFDDARSQVGEWQETQDFASCLGEQQELIRGLKSLLAPIASLVAMPDSRCELC